MGKGSRASRRNVWLNLNAMPGPERIWTALLAALLITHGGQPVAAQKSQPVTTTQDFANALQDHTITEIILDPSGTGVGGGTFALRGDLWVQNTYDITAGRDLTVRSVNGNPTMLDLRGIPAVLEVRANATLELRDMLLKNVATEAQLRAANGTAVRSDFSRVSGMLAWPSFYAEPGASLRIYNTTQYFWSHTIFYRPDCNFNKAGTPPDGQKVVVLRGQQTYSFSASGYTMLAESHLYHARYPVLAYSSNTSQPEGYMDVYSENSYGVCVPTNSSANEVIIGMARAAALSGSGNGNRQAAVTIASVVGAILGAALIAGLVGLVFWVRRRRRQEAIRSLSDLGALPHSEGAPMLGTPSEAPSGTTANTQMETHLMHHARTRRLGALDEEQVEVGPLLGRGSFGRVYKGRWRSTLVAIKVVEHSPGVRESLSVAEQKIEREALLATSLSHPNIIATFKICTMTAGSAVGQKKASMGSGTLSLRRPSDPPGIDQRQSSQKGSLESLPGIGNRAQRSAAASPSASQQGATSPRGPDSQGRQLRPSGDAAGGQRGLRELGSGNSEGRPSSQPSSQPGSKNEGRLQLPASSQGGSKNKGSGDSFDPTSAFVVDLPKSDVAVAEEQKKGSDSAINNGGKRPGLVGASPTPEDIEMTERELEAEDEEAAIEERMSRLLETWCLMEYAEKGSLADALRTGRLQRQNGFPELGVIIACLQDIASGMEYLHSAGILHGDLKPANVLLKSTSADRRGFLCKLCDFGMSRLLDATHATHVSTQTYGTMPYMPPELLSQSQLTPKADVYSFGIVMWELLSGQMPFANLTVGQVFFAVVHEKTRPALDVFDKARQDLPEDEQVMLNKYEALMTSCWAEAPADRPTFTQIVSELGTFRAKISMRLSSKHSEGPGSRKISSLKSGVSSPHGGGGSPFQPASQKPMPPSRPSPPPADEQSGLSLLRSPSFQNKEQAGQGLSEGLPPIGPLQSSRANLERDPVSIAAKSASLRDHVPISRAQLLGGLGRPGKSDSVSPGGSKQSLSLKDLPDSLRARLAAGQEAAAAASNSNNSSEQPLSRHPLANRGSPVTAERSFSF